MIHVSMTGVSDALQERLLKTFPGRAAKATEDHVVDLAVIGPDHPRPLAAAQGRSSEHTVLLLILQAPLDPAEARAEAPMLGRDLYVTIPDALDEAAAAYRRAQHNRRHRATMRRIGQLI